MLSVIVYRSLISSFYLAYLETFRLILSLSRSIAINKSINRMGFEKSPTWWHRGKTSVPFPVAHALAEKEVEAKKRLCELVVVIHRE